MTTERRFFGGYNWETFGVSIVLGSRSPRFQRVGPSAPGLFVKLPPTTYLRNGGPIFVIENYNASGYSFEVQDRDGNVLCVLPNGFVARLYLLDRTTVSGSYTVGTWLVRVGLTGGRGFHDTDIDVFAPYLQAVWHFNEASTPALDATPNHNDLTDISSPTYNQTGISDKAIDFSTGQVQITGANWNGLQSIHSFSVSQWVYFPSGSPGSANYCTWCWDSSINRVWFAVEVGASNTTIRFRSGGDYMAYFTDTNANLFTGTWRHIVGTREVQYVTGSPDRSYVRIYLDSVLKSTYYNPSGFWTNLYFIPTVDDAYTMCVGDSPSVLWTPWPERIDEVCIWADNAEGAAAVLDQDAIDALYNSGAGTFWEG